MIYLSPVLPELAEKTGDLLNDPIVSWDQSKTPLTGTPVAKFKHMMKRIEEKDVKAMEAESKSESDATLAAEQVATAASQFVDSGQPMIDEPMADECTIDEFMKVDLRVARIAARPVFDALVSGIPRPSS